MLFTYLRYNFFAFQKWASIRSRKMPIRFKKSREIGIRQCASGSEFVLEQDP